MIDLMIDQSGQLNRPYNCPITTKIQKFEYGRKTVKTQLDMPGGYLGEKLLLECKLSEDLLPTLYPAPLTTGGNSITVDNRLGVTADITLSAEPRRVCVGLPLYTLDIPFQGLSTAPSAE